MSDLTPEIVADVVAACTANADEVAGALTRTLDAEMTLEVGEPGTYAADDAPEGFDGSGLAVLMEFGGKAAVAMIPTATGLVPDWVTVPDATGESKMSTFGQELSMLLVPDSMMADNFAAAWVPNIAEALANAELAESASLVPLQITAGEQSGQMSLLWPCAAPGKLFSKDGDAAAEVAETEDENAEVTPAKEEPNAPRKPAAKPKPQDFKELPPFARHLLMIKVPVMVNLVAKKQSVEEIMEMGPGAIINFDKSCDSPLELSVGDRKIAVGAAVKVGEKFGLEITEITLPDEAFRAVKKEAS